MLGIVVVAALSALYFLVPHFFYTEKDTAKEQQEEPPSAAQTLAGRKNIYDRSFHGLAVSFRLTSVYVRPLEIKEPQEVAQQLATILDLDENTLLDAIKVERSFVWIGRHIAPKKAEAIAALNLKGVYMIREVQRFYPYHTLAAHVVGFVKDEQGLAGIESFYDNVLRGAGFKDSETSNQFIPADGVAGLKEAHLVLTLDLDVQARLEKQLAELTKKTKAQAAMAAVMRVSDGAILGLANFPTYDLNLFWDYNAAERKNRLVSEQIVPGEMERIFRVAAALDQGRSLGAVTSVAISAGVREDESSSEAVSDWIEASEGSYVSPELQVLGNYSYGQAEWSAFAEKIGLSGKTGIDLPEEGISGFAGDTGEASSDLNNPVTAGTTALSLLTAFTRLVNGGKEVKPHLLGSLLENGKRWEIAYGNSDSGPAIREEISHALLTVLGNSGLSKGNGQLFFESALLGGDGVQRNAPDSPAEENNVGISPEVKAILLGMAPQKTPEIALIIVLDGAQLNLAEPSPLRKMAKGLTSHVLKIARNKTVGAKGPSTPEENEYYEKWLALQPKADGRSALRRELQQEKMPDVRGYSVRKALQTLQDYGLKITIKGSGRVVTQHPAPGTSLRNVEECRLELKMDK